jgi:hypothetical protein
MSAGVKDNLEADVRAALVAAGGDARGINKTQIAQKYLAFGVSRATAFRWIAAALLPEASAAPVVRESTGRRPHDVAEIATAMLAVASEGLGELVSPSGHWIVEGLGKCLQAANDVIAHSRRPDGSIRLAKTMVAASDHLRRVIETVGRIQENVASIQKIDALYDDLLSAVEHVSPSLHARVVAHIGEQDTKWRTGCAAAA